MTDEPTQVVLAGPAGSGKSTQARRLADHLGARYIEGDEFHHPVNLAKMAAGVPLTDDDRGPWLDRLREELETDARNGIASVLACSALTHRYRERLRPRAGRFLVCILEVPVADLERRVTARASHFMPATLVASQVETLEPLTATETGIAVSASGTEDEVFAAILDGLDAVRCDPIRRP